nr:PREDICTED: protein ELYS isoform X3 [Tribolium castaneum]|eukprot:XP_015835953.1 PREDICTED: protein ELYS isoform X3 [Tribolium castaneum]
MSLSVKKIINLPEAAIKFLEPDETEEGLPYECKTIGGVLRGNDYVWLSNGPHLTAINTKMGCQVGAWSFGWVLKDSNTKVVCVDVIQRPNGRLPFLAVGIDCDLSGGMICIFDFATSKIIRAIHVTDKITCLHVIDPGHDVFTLPSPLRNFDGIIAVGTAGGDVFLVDICRQICDEGLTLSGVDKIRDELNPCQLSHITSKDICKIEFHKEFAIRNSQHLAIHLNFVFENVTKHFTLKGPKGDDRIHVSKDEVAVSALYYCPQLGSLLVGYNFGAFQLYNLMNLELIYTSPVCDEHIPISHFAIQEPADDPRPVCYIWAVYSTDEQFPSCLPLAVMYAFSYHSKEYHEGYGFLYQDFSSAGVHFQMELGVPEGHKRSKQRGGRCLKVNSIARGLVNREGPQHDSNEDSLTLCVFVWDVWYSSKESDTFVAVFDLNQWYKEQMPSVLNSQYSSTYMLHIYLNELINNATHRNEPIVDVHIDTKSIQQFTRPQKLEEYFHPNSLSFRLSCLRETDVISLYNCGVQKALLAQIESSGPACVIEPAEIYQELVGLGLVPLFIDLPVNTPVSTNQQREVILSTALENRMVGWLCKCASEWANGSFLSTGCSLDLLINWAFQRATVLKTNADKFCVPLFDFSGTRLDKNTNNLLNTCVRQLKSLCSIYAFIIDHFSAFIPHLEVVEQRKSLEAVSTYFEVLQWFFNVGLLPECPITAYPRSDDFERISAPYPAEMLTEFYNHRRGLLKILNEENFASSDSVLFIDNLIERECGGKSLEEQWRNDGGNGLYPPPSLQALLRTYLIDNVDLSYKHSVIIYVFLDLAMTLDQDRYKHVITYLIKFPAVFKVTPSRIKIIQALWQLDHSDFNTAMGLLLDPLVSSQDLDDWHHKIVLRALMLQKQHNFALLYMQIRKPVPTDEEDILTAISLYVANNMLDEAFYFEKQYTNQLGGKKLLLHLLNECKKNNKLRPLIYRSFNSCDEDVFLKYLRNLKDPTADDLHVYYHILRSRFLEAFESHNRTVPKQIETQGLFGQENATARDKLVYSFKKMLPDVTRNLLDFCHREKNKTWQQVSRPTPMSVFVLNLNENVKYKSTLIGAALEKARQTFNESLSDKIGFRTEETPFLRTPTAEVSSRRSSVVVVNPKIESVQKSSDICTPPSSKRLKLSPRVSASLPSSIPTKLETPLVKRKTPRVREEAVERFNATTPHSILKVKTPSKQFEDSFKEFEKLEYTPVSSVTKKKGLGLSPRKSISKHTPVVRFEGFLSSDSSTLNNSSVTEKESTSPAVNASLDTKNSSSKNTSTEDEVFYSPEASLEEKQSVELENKDETVEITKLDLEETPEEKQASPVYSPRSRRSYKGSISPVRSSPRLQRSIVKETVEEPLNSKEEDAEKDESTSSLEQIIASPLQKLRPRRSLCRKVLETNALNRVLNSPLDSPKSRKSKVATTSEETTEKVVIESTMKFEDGEEMHKTSFTTKHNVTKSLIESDLDSSDFSFQYANTKECLSDSMLNYINNANRSHLEDGEKITDSGNNHVEEESVKEVEEKSNGNEEIPESVSVTNSKSFAHSVLDSTTEEVSVSNGPHCINSSEENAESEVMEVDDEVEIIEEKPDAEKSDEPVYTTLKNTTFEEPKETDRELIYDEGKEEKAQSFERETVDPGMNVFEISEDLSLNDGFLVEQEVTLEENDLCYGQQNTLENVLEENMTTETCVTSTSLNALEKNILNESLEEEESNEENKSRTPEQNKSNDVIEIGSSSEEEKSKDGSSASSSPASNENSEEKLEVSYERNIYDAEYDSSNSYEQHNSEISENSDDYKYENTRQGFGLFKSAFIEEEVDETDDSESDKDNEERIYENVEREEEIQTEKEANQRDNEESAKEKLDPEETEKQRDQEESKEKNLEKAADEEKEIEPREECPSNKRTENDETEKQESHTETVEENLIEDKIPNEEECGNMSAEMEELHYSTHTESEDQQEIQDLKESTREENVLNKTVPQDPLDLEFLPTETEICILDKTNFGLVSSDKESNIKLERTDQLSDTQPIKKPHKTQTSPDICILDKTHLEPDKEISTPKKARSRKNKLETTDQLSETLDSTTQSVRKLRSRTISTEESPKPVVTLRKRSASVDEVKSSEKVSEVGVRKGRSRRAASTTPLPKIEEEGGKKSLLEDYSMTRRVTRRQMAVLKEICDEGEKSGLKSIDPIVLPEGKPESEEQNYETSPTSFRRSRRRRSTSQASDTSQISRSKTPPDGNLGEGRVTRSRAKSVSSEDSILDSSQPGKVSKRKISAKTSLAEIKEEPGRGEKSVVPKKRTRKNSSQI